MSPIFLHWIWIIKAAGTLHSLAVLNIYIPTQPIDFITNYHNTYSYSFQRAPDHYYIPPVDSYHFIPFVLRCRQPLHKGYIVAC